MSSMDGLTVLEPYGEWNGKTAGLCDGHGLKDEKAGKEATAGKRTPYIEELGRFVHENEFNRAVVDFLAEELRRNGFRVLLVAPELWDVSLKMRVDRANALPVDIYISVHYNALDGKFDGEGKDPEGISIYVYYGHKEKEAGRLAKNVAEFLKQGTPQKWRGIYESGFYVVKYTNMPAILTENGFMDNLKEALRMVKESFQKEVAREHAQGACKFFGFEYIAKNEALSGLRKYTIKKGDTLWAIANHFETTVDELQKLNPDVKAHTLKIGSTLIIPGTGDYQIKKGDTFWGIAKKLGTTADDLQRLNPGVDPKMLVVGSYIVTEGALPASEPVKEEPEPEPAKVTLPDVTIGRRSGKATKAQIKEIQKALNALYFKCGIEDGIYGAKTEDAVTRFQKVHLPYDVDGVYGSKTKAKMEFQLNK